MSGNAITQQNFVPNEPELKDVLDLLKKDILLKTNCHALVTVQSFDSNKQTATATVNYKRTYFQPDPTTGIYGPVLVDYPVMADCPVFFLGGGNGVTTYPVGKGDEALALFNDRDMDNWFAGSSSSAVATPRLHSFSDAILLVGVRSLANVITGFNASSAEFRTKSGSARVIVNDDYVRLILPESNMTLEIDSEGHLKVLNANGEDLITSLYNILTTATAGGFPLIVSPTDLAALQSFKPV